MPGNDDSISRTGHNFNRVIPKHHRMEYLFDDFGGTVCLVASSPSVLLPLMHIINYRHIFALVLVLMFSFLFLLHALIALSILI